MNECNDRSSDHSILEEMGRMTTIIFDQLDYADNKANFILVSDMVVFSAAVAALASFLPGFAELEAWKWALLIYLLWLIIFSVVSAVVICWSIFPLLKKTKADRKANVYFYGDVAAFRNHEEYISALRKGNLADSLAEEHIAVSRIVVRKHRLIKSGTKLLLVALLPVMALVFVFVSIVTSIVKKNRFENEEGD